jgi:glyoxylase-like metal-dependent hydrolase (beta-lactamase superfamily II)
VLFAADAAANMGGLGLSLVYEDLAEGRRTLARLAALDFDAALFGHGAPIMRGAAARFRRRWRRP